MQQFFIEYNGDIQFYMSATDYVPDLEQTNKNETDNTTTIRDKTLKTPFTCLMQSEYINVHM